MISIRINGIEMDFLSFVISFQINISNVNSSVSRARSLFLFPRARERALSVVRDDGRTVNDRKYIERLR